MQTAAAKAVARPSGHSHAAYQLMGMLIVSIVPALFWTLIVAGIGGAVGHAPSAMALMTFGTAVALFCAAVFQSLLARH
ncbi:MAG: hypothetical protein WC829_05515 [Hyphomicrobium sp.]|jgi:hypothetical protein